jgi:hypothetical protein
LETAKLNKLSRSELLLRLGYNFKAGELKVRPFLGGMQKRINSRIHSGSLNKSSLQLSGGVPELWDYITDLDRSHNVSAKGVTAGLFLGWRFQDFGLELQPEYQTLQGEYHYLNRSQLLVIEEVPRQIQVKLDTKVDPIYDQAFVESRHASQITFTGYMLSATARYYIAESRAVFFQFRAQEHQVEHKKNTVSQFVLTKTGQILQPDLTDTARTMALGQFLGKMAKSKDSAQSLALGLSFYL